MQLWQSWKHVLLGIPLVLAVDLQCFIRSPTVPIHKTETKVNAVVHVAKVIPGASGREDLSLYPLSLLLWQSSIQQPQNAEDLNHMNRSVIYKAMHIDTSHAELSSGPIFILEIKAALQKVYFNFLS